MNDPLKTTFNSFLQACSFEAVHGLNHPVVLVLYGKQPQQAKRGGKFIRKPPRDERPLSSRPCEPCVSGECAVSLLCVDVKSIWTDVRQFLANVRQCELCPAVLGKTNL